MILSTTRITSSGVLTVIRCLPILGCLPRCPPTVIRYSGSVPCEDLELAGHNTEPAIHAFCLIKNDDTVFNPDCLLPAIVGTGTTAGTKIRIPDGFPDTGNADLIEPLTLAPVRAGRDRNPHFDRQLFPEKFPVNLLCESNTVNNTEFAVPGTHACGNVYDFFPFSPERRPVRFEFGEQPFQCERDRCVGIRWSGGWSDESVQHHTVHAISPASFIWAGESIPAGIRRRTIQKSGSRSVMIPPFV